MRAQIIAFSARGMALGERLLGYFKENGHSAGISRCEEGGLAGWTARHFYDSGALIFISACGIAVRAIAPHIRCKTIDPAVVVLDEAGAYAISLLSGHIGGANALTKELAAYIGATPVITTATDVQCVFTIDEWAKRQGLRIANPERIKSVSARLLAGEDVSLHCAYHVTGNLPAGMRLANDACGADVLITYEIFDSAALCLVPPVVTLGVGCKSGTSAEAIENAFTQALTEAGCYELAVKQVCSIDIKAQEPGLLEFCRRRGLPLRTFSAKELRKAPGEFTASAFVEETVGVDNVCERSAILGAGENGRLLTKKQAHSGVTAALACEPFSANFGHRRREWDC